MSAVYRLFRLYIVISLILLSAGFLQGQKYYLGPQLIPDGYQLPTAPNLLSMQPLVSNCDNSNFSLGTWKGWAGCYGSFYKMGNQVILEPCTTPGFSPTRHIIITGPGTKDPQTCDSLWTVFPGEAFGARLGDYNAGGHAEQLKYTVGVTYDTYLFVYRYAVVLESPNHAYNEQPGFSVEIRDSLGHVIDSTCGYYQYYSPICNFPPNCPVTAGWHYCPNVGYQNDGCYWKNWTTVGMDLSSYLGHVLTIVFTTHGCCYTVHRGYAYLNAYCSYLTMQTAMCEGDTSATLTAPPGFFYYWHTVNGDTTINGDSTQSITVPHPTTGSTYTCTLTAVNGCMVTISQTLTYTAIHANFTHGSSCATIPVQFNDSSYVNQNAVVNWKWWFGDGSPMVMGQANPVHPFATPGTYTVKLISFSTEGCRDSIMKTIYVDSLPTLTNTPLFKKICSNSGTNISLTSNIINTNFTWTATSGTPNITGYSNGSGLVINQILKNTGAIIDTVYYLITPHRGDCDGVTKTYKVAVNPLPQLTNTPLNKSICDSTSTNITLTSNNDSTKFTWICTASSPNVTGYSNNTTTPGMQINQVLYNSGYNVDTVFYHIVGHSYGCNGDTTIYKVIVKPFPNLSNSPPSKTICSNTPTNITLTSNVTGTLFTWNCTPSSGNVTGFANNGTPSAILNQTLINTGSAIETVTYNITPHANGCDGHIFHYIVTVNPKPLVTNTPTIILQCSNVNTNLSLTSNVTGTLYTWTCTPSSGNVSGYSNNAIPAGAISQVLVNTGSVLETVVYHITPIANNCTGTILDFTFKVYPVPDVIFTPPTQNVCDYQTTNITLSSSVASSVFAWTATASSLSVTGYGPGSGTLIAQTLITPGTQPESVTYHVTATANSCSGPVTDYLVVINPKPHLTNNPMHDTICSEASTNISLTASCLNTTFTWTASLMTGNVTGFSNGSGSFINQVLTNNINTTGTAKYTIHPVAGPCIGNDTDYLVYVKPTPHLSNTPPAKQICSGVSTNITLTSTVIGTLFTWTASGSSLQVTGYTSNNTPSITINDLLTNSGFNIETVTYHITPHYNGCDGPATDYIVTVYPVSDAYFQPSSQTICTGQTTSINIFSNVTGATFSWTTTASSPLVIGYSNANGSTIAQTIFSSSTLVETITYHVTPLANGCNGTPSDVVVTVNPGPAITTSPLAQTICSGLTANIIITSNVSGATFTWTASASSPNVTGFSNGIGNSISQVLTNSGFTIETVTYALTPTANGCTGAPVNYVVTVNPVPNLSNSPLSKSQCNSTGTNITLTSNVTGTLFTWTATGSTPQVTGYTNNNIPSITINDNLVNTGFNIETATYHITPHANNCSGTVYNYVVTVYPTPNLSNTPLNKSQCNNLGTNITLTSNVTGTLFTWTATGSTPQVTGFTNNNIPSITINDILVNNGFNTETVTYHITPHANNCDGIVYDYVVTVYPTPNLSNTPLNKSQCNNQGTNINLTSNVSGTLFTWTATGSTLQVTGFTNNNIPSITINDNLVNTGFNIETVTYHITPHANNCNGIVYNYIVTVYPTPNLSNTPLTKSQCNNLATNINLTSNVTGTLFTWTATGSTPQITGFTNNNTPSITINDILGNTGNNIETVTYHITPHANNCDGIVYNYIVTVYPTPQLTTSPLSKSICTNNSISINLTSTVTGTTFAWTCSASSLNLAGYSNGTGNLISQTLSNSGYTIETVTYHITPTANGCAGPVADYVVTVNPKPDVSNNPLSKQQCNNLATNIGLTSHVSGTLFTWTATGSSPQITGYTNNNIPSLTINDILYNSGFNVETVTYHITPIANGCTGNLTDYVVTIVSLPDVYFNPPAQTICNAQTTNIQNLSHVTGTTFTWTATASSLNITGYSGGSGNLIAQMLFNSGSTIETVTYSVLPTAFGCPSGPSQVVVVTVNPKPSITNSSRTSSICSAQSATINPQSSVPGSTFGWIASGSSGNVTGFSNGNGLSITQTLTNTGFNIETVTYILTPTANSCSGDTAHFQVIVYPVADVYFTPATQAICPLQTSNIAINSHVSGSSFTWTANGSSGNVSGYSPGSGNLIQQMLNNSSYNIETVTYHVTPAANGCTGTSGNVIVSVNPNPSVSLLTCWDATTTTSAQPIKLKGGTPLNGTWTGTGVSAGTFYPAVAGVGTFTLTYSYGNSYGCNGNATQSITVIAPPAFNCGSTLTDIRDNQSYPTVQIATQCWMAANLNYGNQVNGSLTQRDNCTPEKFCYNDNPGNCTTYGGLYQWDEMMHYSTTLAAQGFCPPGWHVPTEVEWTTLFNVYISNGFAGSPLKSTGYSGFNAFLYGTRFKNVNWNFLNFATLFWSSSSRSPTKAWAHGMNEFDPSVSFYPSARSNAFSVRCIKD